MIPPAFDSGGDGNDGEPGAASLVARDVAGGRRQERRVADRDRAVRGIARARARAGELSCRRPGVEHRRGRPARQSAGGTGRVVRRSGADRVRPGRRAAAARPPDRGAAIVARTTRRALGADDPPGSDRRGADGVCAGVRVRCVGARAARGLGRRRRAGGGARGACRAGAARPAGGRCMGGARDRAGAWHRRRHRLGAQPGDRFRRTGPPPAPPSHPRQHRRDRRFRRTADADPQARRAAPGRRTRFAARARDRRPHARAVGRKAEAQAAAARSGGTAMCCPRSTC